MCELDHEEGWPPKKLCFWTVVLEKALECHLDGKEINRSILKKINIEYSLKQLLMKLKLQYFHHLIRRADSLEKTMMLGKSEDKRRGKQRMRWLDSITNSKDMNLSRHQALMEGRGTWCATGHGDAVRHDLVTEQQPCNPQWISPGFPPQTKNLKMLKFLIQSHIVV